MQSQLVHIHKMQISNVQIQYVESKIWLQVSAPETILGLEIGFGRRLIAASVTPTITDSDSALLGCRLLPGKNYVFWLRVWKNAWMTPPSHTARPLPHRVNSFWVGPIHVIVAYTGLRTVWSHSRTWSLTFFQKMPDDMMTQISKHWVWFVVCVWSFFLGYLILGM